MTVVDTALRDALRALKLSGMLDTLDARLAQARGGDLGHLEFLQTLCHDAIGRRELTAMGRRLRRAHFDADTTMEEFDFHASPKLPAAQIRDLAALRWLHARESVILYGAASRRPLRADQRTRRTVTGAHEQPVAGGLVSVVPQRRGGGKPAGSVDQHESSGVHERPQLPAEQAASGCRG
jgi:hypothetical protein